MKFFPFTIGYDSRFGGINYDYRALFMANKPKDMIWYAAAVIVHSPTQVEFVVYEMYDNYYGGVGAEIARFFVAVDKTANDKAMEQRSFIMSEKLMLMEERAKRAKRIEAGAKALLAEAYKTP